MHVWADDAKAFLAAHMHETLLHDQKEVVDTTPEIRLFLKLKLTNCARPGTAPGFFMLAVSLVLRRASGRTIYRGQRLKAQLCGHGRPARDRYPSIHNKEKHTTFQAGQSGNPAGRPKGARGKAAAFAEVSELATGFDL
jgi:hypothetical protein